MGILYGEVSPGLSMGLVGSYGCVVGRLEPFGHRGRCRRIAAMV